MFLKNKNVDEFIKFVKIMNLHGNINILLDTCCALPLTLYFLRQELRSGTGEVVNLVS